MARPVAGGSLDILEAHGAHLTVILAEDHIRCSVSQLVDIDAVDGEPSPMSVRTRASISAEDPPFSNFGSVITGRVQTSAGKSHS
jgi:hypothetical protein